MGVLVAGLHQLELLEGLAETAVPAAVVVPDMGTTAQTEVAMVIMEGLLPALHLLVLVRALLLASSAKQLASCMPAAVAAVAEVLLIPTALRAALASCASGCTRRARERGKDNYAVIQERNEDGGIHSAVQQGAPQHRRHHNGAHTAPPGGGLGLAVGAGVLGLPVRAAVAHIPAEDGAEET